MEKIILNNRRFGFLIFLFLLSSCNKTANYIIDYIPYAQIPNHYSLESAKNDDLIVFENGNITSGQDIWDKFLNE